VINSDACVLGRKTDELIIEALGESTNYAGDNSSGMTISKVLTAFKMLGATTGSTPSRVVCCPSPCASARRKAPPNARIGAPVRAATPPKPNSNHREEFEP